MTICWKGIILAGGSGTRLHPLTTSISKQLLPVYDKPMIYYPLTVLMNIGIKNIAIITTPEQRPLFETLLEDGSQWGCHFEYFIQPEPKGLAEAFLLTESFIGDSHACLILGDNIFYGNGLSEICKRAMEKKSGATVFGYRVTDPERYGVVEFDQNRRVISIEEKPLRPKSRYAVPGLYFYDSEVISISKSIKPSRRGELEITDVNQNYLGRGKLSVELIEREIAWLDAGTFESLLEAASFIHAVQQRQGLIIGSPEETAWRNGYISNKQLLTLAEPMKKNNYGRYLVDLLSE